MKLKHNVEQKSTTYPPHVSENPFYRYLWYSVRRDNQNEVIIVYGRPGSTKSSFGLKLMQDIDLFWSRGFKKWVSRAKISNLTFSVSDLCNKARSRFSKGTVFMYDEAGVESDNTSYHEKRAMVLRWILQTWRFKNAILIITLPSLKSLTVGIRRLATVYVECFGRRVRDREHAWARITFISNKMHKDREVAYQKFLRYNDDIDGFTVKKRMKWYVYAKPDKILATAYKRLKEEQTAEWWKGFGHENLQKEMNFMDSIIGVKQQSRVMEEAQTVYNNYRPLLEEFEITTGKSKKLLKLAFEKRLKDDGVQATERGINRAWAWLKGDWEMVKKLESKQAIVST